MGGNSILTLFTPANFAPVILLIGLIIMEKSKKQKVKDIGQMLLGLGILFTGMVTMVNIASSFGELPILGKILEKLSNPVLGVLGGAIITAIVQSSSATVGILLALSTTGQITFATVIPIILGQNIGTCITSIIASIGGSKNAKRVAGVHLYFNLIGTVIFLVFIYTYQHLIGFSFWNRSVDMGDIANFHTVFNIISTIILFPFIKQLEQLTIITVKDDANESEETNDDYLSVLNILDERILNIPSIAITNSLNVVETTATIVEKNLKKNVELIEKNDKKTFERIHQREMRIAKLEKELTKFLIILGSLNLTDEESRNITCILKIESEFEKIGDYTYRNF